MNEDNKKPMTPLEKARQKYSDLIKKEYPNGLNNFYGMQTQGQNFEAIAFELLSYQGLNPELFDIKNGGGPDFYIPKRNNFEDFYIEVTTIDKSAISGRSGIPYPLDYNKCECYSFGADINGINAKLEDKQKQLNKFSDKPIVLFIGSDTAESEIFDGSVLESIVYPPAFDKIKSYEQNKRPWNKDEFKDSIEPSIFFEQTIDDYGFKTKNNIYSSIIFSTFNVEFMYVCGFTHPAPITPFNTDILDPIPFYILREIKKGLICEGDWKNKKNFEWDRFYFEGSWKRGSGN